MLRLLPAVDQPRPPGRVCRRDSCGGEAVEPYGFCERCAECYAEELERARSGRETIGAEIERRFPGLIATLTLEHVAALPAHLAAHYRPGDDWRFVLAALPDCWMETIERLAEQVAAIGDRGW
jgi:hypothetical protein